MDPVTLLTGAGLVFGGGIAGRLIRPRRTPATPSNTCGCGHHFAHHAEHGTGACQFVEVLQEKRKQEVQGLDGKSVYNTNTGGTRLEDVTVIVDKLPCTCQGFTAP